MVKKCIILLMSMAFAVLASCSSSVADLNIKSAQYLNPDVDGQASPIVVTLYQLKNNYAFDQVDYDTLSSDPSSALGDDLIDKTSFEVRPGSKIEIKQPLEANTAYVGIVAAYREPQGDWHKSVKLSKLGGSVDIDIDLQSHELNLTQ